MILLAYIMMGHPEWSRGEISVFAAMPEETQESRGQFLVKMIQKGRLPISPQNVSVLPYTNWLAFEKTVNQVSREADLVMLGFTRRQFEKYGTATFNHFATLRDTLFVCSEDQDIALTDEPDVEDGPTGQSGEEDR